MIKVDQQSLARAVDAGVLNPGQDSALLSFLQQQNASVQATQPSFQLAHVSFYFGAILIMAALGWLLNEAWEQAGNIALLLLSSCYMLALGLGGWSFWQRGLKIPGGLLAAAAVSITPLAVFALQNLLGLWPESSKGYQDYYRYIDARWLPMEIATVVVGLLMLRKLPFPFIVMPIAVALWFMTMDIAALSVGESLSFHNRAQISVFTGLLLIIASLFVDNRYPQDFAFWGYLAGLLAFWGGLTSLDSASEWGKAIYCLINIALMLTAVLLRRVMFLVFGAIGVSLYLGYLAHKFDNALLFPIFLSMIGLGLICLGVLYQRHRQKLSESLRSKLPAALIAWLPALQR